MGSEEPNSHEILSDIIGQGNPDGSQVCCCAGYSMWGARRGGGREGGKKGERGGALESPD